MYASVCHTEMVRDQTRQISARCTPGLAMRVARIAIGGLCILDLTSGFVFPAPGSTCRPARMPSPLRAANDVKVTVEGVVRTVALEEGVSILDGLEAHDIDAPHSCRSGLCTE